MVDAPGSAPGNVPGYVSANTPGNAYGDASGNATDNAFGNNDLSTNYLALDTVNPGDLYDPFGRQKEPMALPPLDKNGNAPKTNAEFFPRDDVDDDDPLLQALLAEPVYGGTWDPRPFPTTAPLDANGNPVPLDLEIVLDSVEQIMRGFETDEGYLGDLSEATSALERAEVARIRFRRCWHVVAIAEIAPAVIAGANARASTAEERKKPIYFVAALDALLESNTRGEAVRKIARWGWIDNRWAWIDIREGTTGQFFCDPYPEQFRLVDMNVLSEQYGVNEIYEQRFPVVEDAPIDTVPSGNANTGNDPTDGSSTVDGDSNVNANQSSNPRDLGHI